MQTTASPRRLKVLVAALAVGGMVALAQRLPQPGWHHLEQSALIAPGVTYRSFRLGWNQKADLIDVTLPSATVRLQIVSEDTGIQSGEACGGRETPAGWLLHRRALAAMNGGYFGRDFPDGHTAFVNLLVQNGRVINPQPVQTSEAGAAFTRSAFAILSDGSPAIHWATTQGNRVFCHTLPAPPANARPWPVREAVGCGPTLIASSRIVVTDAAERCVSPGSLPRTFAAYDGPAGHLNHFVMGVITGAEFPYLGRFLADYFRQYDHTRAAAAMCLDGGPSSQLSYQQGKSLVSPLDTQVEVPDAVLILPKNSGYSTSMSATFPSVVK